MRSGVKVTLDSVPALKILLNRGLVETRGPFTGIRVTQLHHDGEGVEWNEDLLVLWLRAKSRLKTDEPSRDECSSVRC